MPRVTQPYRDRQTARIMAAAEACFARHGFDGASMDQIIAEAGMSSSTVYRYFPEGKQSLIRAVLSKAVDPVVEWMGQLSETEELPPFETAFADAVAQAWNYKQGSEGRVELQIAIWAELVRQPDLRAINAERYARVRTEIAGALGRWQERGDIAPDVNLESAAAVVHNAAMGLLVQRIVTGEPERSAADAATTARALAGLLGG